MESENEDGQGSVADLCRLRHRGDRRESGLEEILGA